MPPKEDRFYTLYLAYLQRVQNQYGVDRSSSNAIAELILQAKRDATRSPRKEMG